MKPGDTLSQIGLAIRGNTSTRSIGRQGKLVTIRKENAVNYGGRAWLEDWKTLYMRDGRVRGYEFKRFRLCSD